MRKTIIFALTFLLSHSIFAQRGPVFSTNDYVIALKHATEVMITDVTSPAAASRYYAYINLAANETAVLFNKQQPTFVGTAHGLKTITVPDSLVRQSDPDLAVLLALYKIAGRLLPSGYLLKPNYDSLLTVAKKRKLSPKKINATIKLVDKSVEQILAYSASDGFMRLSGLKRFTPAPGDAYWKPTAPGFMAAIEPNWNTLRTFILDSCSQFEGEDLAAYNTDTSSSFYKAMKEVYDIQKNLTAEQGHIAMFWDCNPFNLQQLGHLEFGIKKISPGGHWMGITGIACKKKKLNLDNAVYVHTLVSIGLADAFISSWNDKYKSNRVRPITAIQKLIEPGWVPVLQTPPFPEYTSAHSVISTTSSVILTHLFGANFAFTDNTEEEFGLPSRSFNSFTEASNEAAISRLYGGIHFRDAVENGVVEGQQIGSFIVSHCPDVKANSGNNVNAAVVPKN
ncbi:MAG: vanadium-dependent haloperoxidase [Ginsengibacter sp.]